MSELCSKLTVKAVVDVIDQLTYTCSKSRMEISKICSKLTIKIPERRH